jgi:tetratricopeptide (TPR) repeat protein
MMKTRLHLLSILTACIFLPSCEKFFDPDLGIVLDETDIFNEFNDFRTAGLGLYGIQQELAEQIYVLGEVRGDLLQTTENADRDLAEVNDFSISPGNRFASPENFYKLVVNCNNLINQIVKKRPSVLDRGGAIDNYDRLYGEVQCMRAWAYFNAARIYGEIPYIYPGLQSMDEIDEYVNAGTTVVTSETIVFDLKGHFNDTLRNVPVTYDRIFLDMNAIIDSFTIVLENSIKAVGIQYNIDNGDVTWEATTWTEASLHALLGQMYLYRGDYARSMDHLDYFLNYPDKLLTGEIKYGLDKRFRDHNWINIFTSIDVFEHIFSVWYSRSYRQQNSLQYYFSNLGGNRYMLKPTPRAIQYWESTFDGMKIFEDPEDPSNAFTVVAGTPGDFYRGYGVSYLYYKNGVPMLQEEVELMLELKLKKREREVKQLMSGVDTVVYKYSINKSDDARDAFITIFRAAGMHLYAAEVYAMWEFIHPGDVIYAEPSIGLTIANTGDYANDKRQLGVRGRVGLSNGDEQLRVGNINYLYHPSTNEITGYIDLTGRQLEKQKYAVELILDERAREMGFEGERFYDLVRVARRTGNPSFLADKVAAKFEGHEAERIRTLLMDESNWYLPFFLTDE